MSTNDFFALADRLRQFDADRTVLKAVRQEIRAPIAPTVRAVRARAVAILPHSGGLNAWVAGARVTSVIRFSGRSVGIRLRAGRNSLRKRSDIKRIDQGVTRHPTFGRRGAGFWFTETVPPDFFTGPAREADWGAAVQAGVRAAVRKLRG